MELWLPALQAQQSSGFEAASKKRIQPWVQQRKLCHETGLSAVHCRDTQLSCKGGRISIDKMPLEIFILDLEQQKTKVHAYGNDAKKMDFSLLPAKKGANVLTWTFQEWQLVVISFEEYCLPCTNTTAFCVSRQLREGMQACDLSLPAEASVSEDQNVTPACLSTESGALMLPPTRRHREKLSWQHGAAHLGRKA